MSNSYNAEDDADCFPRRSRDLKSRNAFMRTIRQECCIYPVRIYDAGGNVKKDVSVKKLMARHDKKLKTKGNFHAPL